MKWRHSIRGRLKGIQRPGSAVLQSVLAFSTAEAEPNRSHSTRTELIREQFGVRWTALAMFVLRIANGAVTIAEFAGIPAAGGLFGIPPIVSVPISALVVWLIVVRGSYSAAEKIFLVLGAALLTYVAAAVLAGPNWNTVAVESVTPSFSLDAGYLTTFMTLVGTTITPYMLSYLQSSISPKGLGMADYPSERTDVVIGSVLSDLVASLHHHLHRGDAVRGGDPGHQRR